MNKTLLAIAVFAGIFAASCQKESTQGLDSSEQNSLQFTASIEDGVDTKTTVEKVAGDPVTYKTKWESTDSIRIQGAIYTATPETDATHATFTKKSGADPTGSTFKAYYPATMFDGTTATLPASYTYKEGKYNMPMYAESNTTALSFKNLCGVLAITIPGTLFTTMFSSVKSITVLSDKQMNGAFTATEDGVLTFASKSLTNNDKRVILEFSKAKIIDESSSATFYIPVPAGTHSPLTIIVSNGSLASIMVTKKSGGVTVERNKVYPINFADNQPEMLPGVFTVGKGADGIAGTADDVKVCFSRGNLQYRASDKKWQIAGYQYSYIGNAAGNNTAEASRASQSDWIDFFGWGATGHNSYGQQPYSIDTTGSKYKTVENASGSETLTISNMADWGYCMGGNESIWRTLTKEEWQYLLSDSPTGRGIGNTKFRIGVTVCGISNCLVIAPDGYTKSIADTYSIYGWPVDQAEGLVCLPPAGHRHGSEFREVGSYGYYWSSTAADNERAYLLHFTYSSLWFNPASTFGRCWGYSVRLVSNAN